jgi:hypothetical protein
MVKPPICSPVKRGKVMLAEFKGKVPNGGSLPVPIKKIIKIVEAWT